jgi:hypothetical protein
MVIPEFPPSSPATPPQVVIPKALLPRSSVRHLLRAIGAQGTFRPHSRLPSPACVPQAVRPKSGTITAASVLASPTTQQLPAGDLQKVIRALRAGAGYANVHTANSPGGEIRGQIE